MAKKQSFEDKLKKLEKIAEDMGNSDISLEKALSEFKQGVGLAGECKQIIEDAQLQIKQVTEESGKIEVSEFSIDDEESGESDD